MAEFFFVIYNFFTYLIQFCRCIDIGKYAMIGSSERKCIKSKWTGSKPHCFGLNQENDYASKCFVLPCM